MSNKHESMTADLFAHFTLVGRTLRRSLGYTLALSLAAFAAAGCSSGDDDSGAGAGAKSGSGGGAGTGGSGGSGGGVMTDHELNDWKIKVTAADGTSRTYDVNADDFENEVDVAVGTDASSGASTSTVDATFRTDSYSENGQLAVLTATMLWAIPGDLAKIAPIMASESSNTNYMTLQYSDRAGESWQCQSAKDERGAARDELGTYSIAIDSASREIGLGNGGYELVHGTAHVECPGGGTNPGAGTVTMDMTF